MARDEEREQAALEGAERTAADVGNELLVGSAGKQDKALARPFRPYYAPQGPAQYYVEGDPSLLERVSVGDRLEFA